MMRPSTAWTSLLGSRGQWKTIPTVDYYFLGAMHDLVRDADEKNTERPVVRVGPTVFASGRRSVILRYVTRKELEWIRANAFERVYYVVDDMLPIAGSCEELPTDYRARLAAFAREILPAILALNPIIVAPSEAILKLFPGYAGKLLDPCCLQVCQDFSHFGSKVAPPPQVRLAFLGTRSHAAGIGFLAPILACTLAARADIGCTFFLGSHLPNSLKSLKNIENRPPLSWENFRRFSARERYHVVLVPLPRTPFNEGRSLTKLLDVASVGAAGLFSNRTPFTRVVTNGRDGLLLDDSPDQWSAAIERLAGDLAAARTLAENAVAAAQHLGERRRIRQFWMARLGL